MPPHVLSLFACGVFMHAADRDSRVHARADVPGARLGLPARHWQICSARPGCTMLGASCKSRTLEHWPAACSHACSWLTCHAMTSVLRSPASCCAHKQPQLTDARVCSIPPGRRLYKRQWYGRPQHLWQQVRRSPHAHAPTLRPALQPSLGSMARTCCDGREPPAGLRTRTSRSATWARASCPWPTRGPTRTAASAAPAAAAPERSLHRLLPPINHSSG